MGYTIMDECRSVRFAANGRGCTKSVLMMLARHADDTTRRGWPGWALLADEVDRTEDAVRDAVKLLQDLGFVKRMSLPTGRGNRVHWVITPASAWPSNEDITLELKKRAAKEKS